MKNNSLLMELPLQAVDAMQESEMLLVVGGNAGLDLSDGTCDGANNGSGVCNGTNNSSGTCGSTNNGSGRCGVKDTIIVVTKPTLP